MLASLEDANGNMIQFSYVAENWLQLTNGWKLTQIRDTQGRVTTFTYNDTIERLTRITDPSGRIYQYGYNGSGQLTSYTDPTSPAGKVTTYAYNGAGLLSRITDPKGNQTRFTYDVDHRVLTVRRVTNNTAGTGPTTTYTYGTRASDPTLCDDPAWIACTQTTDPNGNRTKYYYDPFRLVRKVKDALGNNVSTEYTADYNVRTSTSASGGTATNVWNETNNTLQSSALPTGATTRWGYPNPGTQNEYRPTSTTDPQGKVTSFTYDPRGNLTELTNAAPTQNKAFYNYDPNNGNVLTATDFKGNATSYGYDTQGNLTSVDNPGPLGNTSYTYDSLSRVLTETDGKSQTTRYAYDALDRVTSITYHDNSTITYTYDANGNVLTMADNTGTTSYVYDALNRLTKETLPGPKVNSYFYDNASNLSAFEDAGAGSRVMYGYDARNLLVTLTELSGSQITFEYWPDHLRKWTRYPNGVDTYMEYDAANRLTWIYSQKNSGGPKLTEFKYCYKLPLNAACTGGAETDTGQRQRVIDKDENATIYSYDDLGRLKIAEERDAAGGVVKSYHYAYDANSNRCAQRILPGPAQFPFDCTAQPNANTTTYSHNAADQLTQLTQAGATTFTYDGNGNETQRSDGRAAAHNAKDQTTSMTPPNGSAIPMSYSGTGQSRRVSAGTTTFQGNALGLGRETTGGSSTTYLRDSSGLLLKQRTGATDHYFLFDGLGSVVALTDSAGNIATTYKYEPFGKLVTSTGTVVNKWRWQGAEGAYFDTWTGLYKMGERFYDEGLGRFSQVDPIPGGGLNAYDYSLQDPVNYSDCDGTFWGERFWNRAKKAVRGTWNAARYAGRKLAGAVVFGVAMGIGCYHVGKSAADHFLKHGGQVVRTAGGKMIYRDPRGAILVLAVGCGVGATAEFIQWWNKKHK